MNDPPSPFLPPSLPPSLCASGSKELMAKVNRNEMVGGREGWSARAKVR